MKRYLAEAIGTYGLVFAGTGSVLANASGDFGLVGISMVFGLVVMAMIFALGDISGAHINPAVTIGAVVAKRMPAQHALPYIIAQCVGALAASATLRLLYPEVESLGATTFSVGVMPAFLMEAILTFFLMLVILGVTATGKSEVLLAAVAIGGTVSFEVFLGGPMTGASMNPARSIGPAIVGGNAAELKVLWLYLVAPVVGAVLASLVDGFLRSGDEATEE